MTETMCNDQSSDWKDLSVEWRILNDTDMRCAIRMVVGQLKLLELMPKNANEHTLTCFAEYLLWKERCNRAERLTKPAHVEEQVEGDTHEERMEDLDDWMTALAADSR